MVSRSLSSIEHVDLWSYLVRCVDIQIRSIEGSGSRSILGFFAVLLARTTIIALMEKISVGELRVLTEQGIYTFGKTTPEDDLRAEIRVINDAFWVRMFMLSDLGFAEAYMVGDIQVSNLDSLFKASLIDTFFTSCRAAVHQNAYSAFSMIACLSFNRSGLEHP